MSDYPSSSLAYPLLNQLLDSLLPFPVSSTSSTFTLSTMDTSLSVTSSSDTSLSLVSSSSSVSSTPTLQPPLSSLVTTTPLPPPLSSTVTTTSSLQIPVISSLPHPTLLTTSNIPLHPHDAVATSPNLQQFSAVRQLTHDLQIKNHGTQSVHSSLHMAPVHLSVDWSTVWSTNRNFHNISTHSKCMKNI